MATPHKDKLIAALTNPKAAKDADVLKAAVDYHADWVRQMETLTSVGKQRVVEMVSLLNAYKDIIEIELIMKKGSDFLRRQKGQLKLDNSINEEFFARLIHLLRHAKRLPFDKRSSIQAVERQHKEYPIDSEVVWRFVEEIQAFVNAIWYDPAAALARGSFI